MMRPLEYRVRSLRAQHVTALVDEWAPATVARIAEELTGLVAGRDPTAVLEVRPRRDVERARRRRRPSA
jgi:hypothetical protein